MPSFDFSKLGYYQNLFLFTFVTSRLALILPPSEITADNSGSWSDSNPIVIQCLKKTGSANWTTSRSKWDYNPIRLTWQKRALCVTLSKCHLSSVPPQSSAGEHLLLGLALDWPTGFFIYLFSFFLVFMTFFFPSVILLSSLCKCSDLNRLHTYKI